MDPEQEELISDVCNFQPSIDLAQHMIKPMLSEIRDMTDEESSIDQDQ